MAEKPSKTTKKCKKRGRKPDPQKTAKKRKKDLKPFQDEKGRFKPGNLANPGGRPRGAKSLTTILRQKLSEEAQPGSGVTWGELLVNKLIKVSTANGNTSALQMVFDRIDGKVPDKIQHQYGPDWEIVYDLKDEDEEHGPDDASED